jgi:hypothetical protein
VGAAVRGCTLSWRGTTLDVSIARTFCSEHSPYITWMSSQATDFFVTGLQKCIPLYDKCLNFGNDYVQN